MTACVSTPHDSGRHRLGGAPWNVARIGDSGLGVHQQIFRQGQSKFRLQDGIFLKQGRQDSLSEV